MMALQWCLFYGLDMGPQLALLLGVSLAHLGTVLLLMERIPRAVWRGTLWPLGAVTIYKIAGFGLPLGCPRNAEFPNSFFVTLVLLQPTLLAFQQIWQSPPPTAGHFVPLEQRDSLQQPPQHP